MTRCWLHWAAAVVFCLTLASALPLRAQDDAEKRVSHELTNQEEDLKRLADKSAHASVTLLHNNDVTADDEPDLAGQVEGEPPVFQEQSTGYEDAQLEPETEHETPDVEEETPGVEEETPDVKQDTSDMEQGTSDIHPVITSETSDVQPETEQVPWTSQVAPEKVAMFLAHSGDLGSFVSALEDLVSRRQMSLDEAEDYERRVADIYSTLLHAADATSTALPTPLLEKETSLTTKLAETTTAKPQPIAEEDSAAVREHEMYLLQERRAYMAAMQATLRRLFSEAARGENAESEQTLKDFFEYVTQLSVSGQLKDDEIAEVIGMIATATDAETTKPLASDIIDDKVEEKETEDKDKIDT